MTDSTDEVQKPAHLFQPGQSGNPSGRPKGSRNKLSEASLADMLDAWDRRGREAIERVIDERPHEFLKVVAGLLPKEFKIETTSDLTDEQLDARIRQLGAVLQRFESGADLPAGGGEAPEGPQTAH